MHIPISLLLGSTPFPQCEYNGWIKGSWQWPLGVASSQLTKITPVKKSVNHVRTETTTVSLHPLVEWLESMNQAFQDVGWRKRKFPLPSPNLLWLVYTQVDTLLKARTNMKRTSLSEVQTVLLEQNFKKRKREKNLEQFIEPFLRFNRGCES